MDNQIIETKNLDNFIKDNYVEYGTYINLHRSIVHMDGLKPVYRRAFLGLHDIYKSGRLNGTIQAVGAVQVYHPFGEASTISVLADLARVGKIASMGDVGIKLMEDIPAAAARYTKVGLTDQQHQYYFKFLKYSNIIDGEEKREPENLIFPVPLALELGSLNWGLGINTRLPAFTYKSIVEAYRSDDYNKLVSSYDYTINHDRSELKELWETGEGYLEIAMKVKRINSDTIVIMGSGELFKPNLNVLKSLIVDEQIRVINNSSDCIELRIERVPRARLVNMDDVFELCKSMATNRKLYKISVVKPTGKIEIISIKDWVGFTMNRYKETLEQSKQDRVSNCEFNISVFESLSAISKLLMDDMDDKGIIQKLDISQDVLNSAKSKSLSLLRRGEFNKEIDKYTNRIKDIKKEEFNELVDNFME